MDPRSAVLAAVPSEMSSRVPGESAVGAASTGAASTGAASTGLPAGSSIGARVGVAGDRRTDARPGARPRPRPAGRDAAGREPGGRELVGRAAVREAGGREAGGRGHPLRGHPAAAPERVLGAYTSGARARLVRRADGPAVVSGCRPVVRPRPALADPRCVPAPRPRPSRLSRYERTGGARRLAGEARTGLFDRVLAVVAVTLASATVVVALGLLSDLVAR
ncbi:hypothetical protein LWC33_20455 [Pseudonocardia sp. RS11V-5]|uniref:hypothetical protein n=1 Tax=Pseudonocardia terrae TaxID=2905831 RepID=UPI001E434EBE|nr:hypothetical protein [Pseudonocardia terrae]MCE3553815.1 hypothetical protein [Pseudonocardia terrae]